MPRNLRSESLAKKKNTSNCKWPQNPVLTTSICLPACPWKSFIPLPLSSLTWRPAGVSRWISIRVHFLNSNLRSRISCPVTRSSDKLFRSAPCSPEIVIQTIQHEKAGRIDWPQTKNRRPTPRRLKKNLKKKTHTHTHTHTQRKIREAVGECGMDTRWLGWAPEDLWSSRHRSASHWWACAPSLRNSNCSSLPEPVFFFFFFFFVLFFFTNPLCQLPLVLSQSFSCQQSIAAAEALAAQNTHTHTHTQTTDFDFALVKKKKKKGGGKIQSQVLSPATLP